MLIGNDWKVESSGLNVVLFRRKKRVKEGAKEAWEAVGYFATSASALHELVNRGVRETGLKDLKTVVEKIAELYVLIEGLTNVDRCDKLITKVSK